MVGMILIEVIKHMTFYKNLSNLNFIKSERLNKLIGLGFFKWIVKNTFFKYLNQKLKVSNKVKLSELNELRKDMTYAEITHLIGFVFTTVFVFLKFIKGDHLFGLTILLVSIILNLYPALLQQLNKRRIDKFLIIHKFNNFNSNKEKIG
jgi:ABC-type protease/lipase transport system fused ATPase/permease subunit